MLRIALPTQASLESFYPDRVLAARKPEAGPGVVSSGDSCQSSPYSLAEAFSAYRLFRDLASLIAPSDRYSNNYGNAYRMGRG